MPQQVFANWSADRLIFVFAGHRAQGLADGSFLRIRAKSDGFTSRNGSDSLVTHSRSNDHRREVSLILEASSLSNAVFSAVHEIDKAAPNGSGVAPMLIQDLNGTTKFTAEIARIMKAPDMDLARESGTLEWLFEAIVPPGKGIVGGR